MKRKKYYYDSSLITPFTEEWIYDVINILPKEKIKILDIGCGDGTYSSLLKLDKNEVWGMEISKKSVELSKEKIDCVIHQDAEEGWNVPSNSFDVVTMLRYLEHVFDYNFQLREAHRVLKDRGLLIIYSPNMSILERIRLLFGFVPAYESDMEHIRQFTKPFLYKILKENGFNPEYCQGSMFILPKIKKRIKIIERFSPNSCPAIIIKAKRN